MTALSHTAPATAESSTLTPARERELLDRIAQLEADLADRDARLDDYRQRMQRIRRNLAYERELTDRALRRRFWWW